MYLYYLLLAPLFLIPLLILWIALKSRNEKSAFIVVLGDLGRSPRMNYHCLSLVKLGYKVTMIGYKENKSIDEIENNVNVTIEPLMSYPKLLQFGPSFAQYIMKALFLSATLLISLLKLSHVPKFVLVQNPPSIPTLALVYYYTRVAKTKFIIDWHNYGFTIMALKSGAENALVKICKKFELFYGQKSDVNFCVTSAMRQDLEKFNIKATTMYDKPHERFSKLDINQKHEFYNKLANVYTLSEFKGKESSGETIITERVNGKIQMKSKRPVVVVSSSSWTEDEDFHILIDAFQIYQNKIDSQNSKVELPNIICALTGKGPLKEYYQKKFMEKKFKNIQVIFLWLEPNDYPLLLGSADLGICFHKSSSNLDLPMKVVDMFGARLPVCALEFSCISELVKNNENGLLFSNPNQLSDHFCKLLPSVSEKNSLLDLFRGNLESFSNWNEEWNAKIKPLLTKL